jgi:glycine hydroxymethyltransferase
VDRIERLAIERAERLFDAQHANVQPYSASLANMAVYFSVLEKGDSILAMRTVHGGHRSHGHSENVSGLLYDVTHYGVDKETEQIDYDELAEVAGRVKPKLIVVGSSTYSRIIDFQRFREIADRAGAYVLADISHVAGLVAAGCHPNPVPHCEFVTATTQKTLRGPRGGLILCQDRFAEDIDRQVFPGLQGAPMMHAIAAKAVCFYEAQRPSFKKYQEQVVRNAQKLAEELAGKGLRIVSGGTDNHMLCVDLASVDLSGKDAAEALERAGFYTNKIQLPFDSES